MNLAQRYLPIMLVLLAALWGVEHFVSGGTGFSGALAVLNKLPLSELIGLALVVVSCIWLVKWIRHRLLVVELKEAAERKRKLQREMQRSMGGPAAAGSASSPAATVPPPATQTAAPAAAPPARTPAQAPAQGSLPMPDADVRKAMSLAQTLLASHLATYLSLQGVTAAPRKLAKMLVHAHSAVLDSPTLREGGPRDVNGLAYFLAAKLAQQVRGQILDDASLKRDREIRVAADALLDVRRVLLEGPSSSWDAGTVEGLLLQADDEQKSSREATEFAYKHGPMGKVMGGLTSGQITRGTKTKPAASQATVYHYSKPKKTR